MPLSPALSHNDGILEHGLHHIVKHNAANPYPREQYHDEGILVKPQYGSPTPGHDDAYTYRSHSQPPRFTYQQYPHQDSGLGVQYDGYHPEYHGQVYQDQYSTPATSPPPPSISSQDIIRTRSGLVIPRTRQSLKPMPEGRQRSSKSPKPRKAKKEKTKMEKKVAKLDKPLSELTKDWKHVAVADIETYVNRSAEERRREVEEGKIPGKIKRPMNSFMLYRKAYQNRTKDWCLQNNHQVVSQVCGDSWPLEPDEVKEQFSEWARIERVNHQNAHPGYKFSPSKPANTKPSKRKMSEEPMSDGTDLDDFDWRDAPSQSKKKYRPAPRQESSQPVAYPTTRSAYQYSSRGNSIEPSHAVYNRSSYQYNNPNRALPPQYNQADLQPGQYYQQTIQHNSMIGVEDVIIRKQAAPSGHSYLGIPGGGQDYDLLNPNPYPQYEVPALSQEHRIDPSLISQGQGGVYENGQFSELHPDGVYFGHDGDEQWQGQYSTADCEHDDPSVHFLDEVPRGESVPIQDHHVHILRGHQEGWHVESLDPGPEFENWMDG